MKQENILELKQITKQFPGVKALDNVSFNCRYGEVHALVGENGAGKSTLMKILSGVYRQTEGEIFYKGETIEFNNPHEAQLKGISIIFQEFSLIKNFTVAENVFLNREPAGAMGHLRQNEARVRTKELLDEIGFDLDVDAVVENLSIVQQQVVEIVKALSVTASIVIMDEPTAALTDKEVRKLFEIIGTLKKKGVTVIYISHMLEEVFEIAERVTVLKDGKTAGTKNIDETFKADLIRMMVGREIGDYFPDISEERKEPILRAENITIEGKLNNVSFELYAGEVLGIAGMVGSGRNALARSLLGLEEIAAGKIRFKDRELIPKTFYAAVTNGFGYIPEDRKNAGILGNMTVKENITIVNLRDFLKVGFIQGRREVTASKEQVKKLNIKVSGIGQEVETLSGGNQQKVLIARWLQEGPDVYIFSEPTRGIDVGAKSEIYRLIRRVTGEGKAVIMISSELPEIIGMSDRIVVMRAGTAAGIIDQHEHRATEEEIMSYAVGHEYSIHRSDGKQ